MFQFAKYLTTTIYLILKMFLIFLIDLFCPRYFLLNAPAKVNLITKKEDQPENMPSQQEVEVGINPLKENELKLEAKLRMAALDNFLAIKSTLTSDQLAKLSRAVNLL